MILHKPGMVATQNFSFFTEVPIGRYLKPSLMLKFWRVKNLTQEERTFIFKAVNRRLSLPLWKKTYDWLGIIGQFFKIRRLNDPFKTYCSEQVHDDYLAQIERIYYLVPKKPSPSDLDRVFKMHPEHFEALGYWWDS